MHETYSTPDGFDVGPGGPRIFRPLRQRARARVPGEASKSQSARLAGEESMDAKPAAEPETEPLLDRATLCLPSFEQNSIVHGGENGFADVLQKYFPTAESNASERLVQLKSKLRSACTHEFWAILMEEICDITGSQCAFVAKRMLVDDQDSAVEMPDLGEPGSCLMGVAFYINNGKDVKKLHRDYRYHAYGTPCAHMKYEKVFIVPERMTEFIPNNPNPMPWKRSDAFIGLPLFNEGKCFAHFGMVWSSEGAASRKLGWGFLEMLMHSLEDMILERILEGRGYTKEAAPPQSTSARIIPLSAITASQSLKPYARSLSHELRTPMQGVVGMLDIMYSTVLDAIANQQSDRVRAVFQELKSHIELVQDSSKRAVEAADNVVHAYDLNMQMPDAPFTPVDAAATSYETAPLIHLSSTDRAGILPSSPSKKRQRTEEPDFHPGPPLKRMFTVTESEMFQKYYGVGSTEASTDGPCITITEKPSPPKAIPELEYLSETAMSDKWSSPVAGSAIISADQRRVITRDFMRTVVAAALKNGHPTSEVHTETELGETVTVTTLGSRGEVQNRTIHLQIEHDVPEAIITAEQHLQFSLQKVIDNAIKFTESGSITITVKVGENAKVVEIWVVDTGCGIAEEFKSYLFQPHFQEDASTSRSRDGLGLSLFNAKAHVRKNLGGDVTLERSATAGPLKGSEFLIRLPISPAEAGSLDAPLVGTGTPSRGQPSRPLASLDQNKPPSSSPLSKSKAASHGARTRSSPSKPSQERVAINRNLAKQCPLNILIAEDNAINRNVAIGSLNKLGYSKENITVAFDGLEAVERYKTSLTKPSSERFNVILMDIWMPNMDGYEATTKIMELAKENEVKTTIIAVTADITQDCVSRARDAGMQGFLAKPYKVLDVEHLIVEHFQN